MENKNIWNSPGERILIVKINDKSALDLFHPDDEVDLNKQAFQFKNYFDGNGGNYRHFEETDTIQVFAKTLTFLVHDETADNLGMRTFKDNYGDLFEVAMNNPEVSALFDGFVGRTIFDIFIGRTMRCKSRIPVTGIEIVLAPGSIDRMLQQKTTRRYENFDSWDESHVNRTNPAFDEECKLAHDSFTTEAVETPNTKNLINSLVGEKRVSRATKHFSIVKEAVEDAVTKHLVDELVKPGEDKLAKEIEHDARFKSWTNGDKCHYVMTGNALGEQPELFFTKLGRAQSIVEEAERLIRKAYDLIHNAPFEIRHPFLRMRADVGFSDWAIARAIDYWNNAGHAFKLANGSNYDPPPESVSDIKEMLDLRNFHFEYDGDSGSEELIRGD